MTTPVIQSVLREVKHLHLPSGHQVCKSLNIFAAVAVKIETGKMYGAGTQGTTERSHRMVIQAIF